MARRALTREPGRQPAGGSAAPGRPGCIASRVELAEEAGRRLGLAPEQVLALRRAGFVHGFGRLGVSNAIWDRPGPLSAGEWERIRIGASSRAAAAMFAVQHGLLPE